MRLRDLTILLYDISELLFVPVSLLAVIALLLKVRIPYLLLFLVLNMVLRTASVYMADAMINTMPVYHVLGAVDLVLCFLIYRVHVSNRWTIAVAIVLLLYVFNSVALTSVFESNSVGLTAVQFFILLLGFNYLSALYKEGSAELEKEGFFWMNAGFMIYAAGAFFVNLMSSKIVSKETNDLFHNAWIIEAIVGILRLFLIAFGYLVALRARK